MSRRWSDVLEIAEVSRTTSLRSRHPRGDMPAAVRVVTRQLDGGASSEDGTCGTCFGRCMCISAVLQVGALLQRLRSLGRGQRRAFRAWFCALPITSASSAQWMKLVLRTSL